MKKDQLLLKISFDKCLVLTKSLAFSRILEDTSEVEQRILGKLFYLFKKYPKEEEIQILFYYMDAPQSLQEECVQHLKEYSQREKLSLQFFFQKIKKEVLDVEHSTALQNIPVYEFTLETFNSLGRITDKHGNSVR